jgi:hypothetical protein
MVDFRVEVRLLQGSDGFVLHREASECFCDGS